MTGEPNGAGGIPRGRDTGRGRVRTSASVLVALVLSSSAVLAACGSEAARSPGAAGEPGEVQSAENAARGAGDGDGVVASPEDWEILARKIAGARESGLDTVPLGEAIVRLGRTFVGTPYVPQTLEVEGPERLVVNLRALDCVTFVETVLATVHLVRGAGGDVDPRDPAALERAYRRALVRIRYRGGELDGYPSRLHYFSEWIRDGEEKGIVRDVTSALGGVPDPEPVTFMTSHPDAYRQLADPEVRRSIGRVEERISRTSRIYLPQDRIAGAADRIRDGDVIAATSSVEGLDVAHTGFAVRHRGRLHLLHAPLVGDSVQLSERTLARRIAGNEGQDGILVARPLPPEPLAGAVGREGAGP